MNSIDSLRRQEATSADRELDSKASCGAAQAALQIRAIEIFVAAADAFRMPKSVGEIYGLLFVSLQPVPLEHILRTLHMSRGTAGQALRLLRNIGAVKRVYAGERLSNCDTVSLRGSHTGRIRFPIWNG